MGAIANEGGLTARTSATSTIRPDYSLVELPAVAAAGHQAALERTRISGKLIELRRDGGPPTTRESTTPQRKPRRKD